MLATLSPARRRLVLAIAGLVALALVVGVVLATSGGEDVDPAAQDRPGPVLLVPGYGGSGGSLQPLADQLRSQGREVVVVDTPGNGTGDLRAQAASLDDAVDAVLAETGASSVDVVGYSAGGVVARTWVAELGGDSLARRVVTLASPHHGTELAALGSELAGGSCPQACQQLAPGSDLLRDLNAGDETPDGPRWVTIWTEGDRVVLPPTSGRLDGALGYAVQDVCPDLSLAHAEVPRSPAVILMARAALGADQPAIPGSRVCDAELAGR